MKIEIERNPATGAIHLWVFGQTPSGVEAIARPVELSMVPMFDMIPLEQPPTLTLSREEWATLIAEVG